MQQNFEVKIIRLTTGEDLIGFIYQDKESNISYLKYPKSFYYNLDTDTNEDELILIEWLPSAAYALQEISLESSHILFTSHANLDFGHVYLQQLIDMLNPELDIVKDIKETLSELDELKDQTIH